MDWQTKGTSVVILGAGFSVAATDGDLPLMRNYFDRLDSAKFPLLYRFVESVASDVPSANVERVLLSLDQIRTSPFEVLDGWADEWFQRRLEIQSELSSYTLGRLRDCFKIPEDNWAAELLFNCDLDTTVISMNYDNIAERIMSHREGIRHGVASTNCAHCKMRNLLSNACSCDGRAGFERSDWQGAILKLHGSIAWKRCLNPSCCSYGCLVADAQCRPFEPCHCKSCSCECGPVLVMPTMSKNLNDVPEIRVMWQAARMALAEAESILFFGFSMPSSDELLVQMIRQAIVQNRALRRVASIDLYPEGVLKRFQDCLPNDLNVELTPLAVVPGERPQWFASTAV